LYLNKRLIKFLIISLLGIVFLFSGCTSRVISSGSNSYFGKKTYKQIPHQKIRNSKAMHRATMRPYVIAGKRYYPTLAKVGDVQKGIASWYGPNFHAKKTSNGEIYNMYADTAAHKTLPMNTMVKVYNKENGKSVIVRINDRGPFVSGRIIDLSNKSAHDIGMVKKGTAKVDVTVLGFHAKIAQTKAEREEIATVGKYYIQIGAFSRLDGAKITKRKFELVLEPRYNVIIKSTDLNRVWISGFRSEAEAVDFKNANGLSGSMIIAE